MFPNGQCNGCCHNEANVQIDADRLNFGHNLAKEDCNSTVRADGAYVRAVDDRSGGSPLAITGD